MSELELAFYKCPKCQRILKPTFHPMNEEHIHKIIYTSYDRKKIKKVESPDLLTCRYCKISVKVSLLRNQKDPIKFLEDFKKIPIGYSISEDTKEKIRLKEDHEENMTKYKHYPVPNKCPMCNSKDIVADCSDHGWICISCDEYFGWHSFRVIFHGDVELEAENKDMASEKAYYYLREGNVDIEADVNWM